ncbi:L,D-transpeptidase family protein [Asanoa sp. WMMD1127]|uniref:L,D-transpeptidase family protein n=1 Tax=Asanoa sp. WMMD1127 TaxID=3016107 RepID=UPI0024162BFE|nr:L,D-transpeptidase family protein [Asanoa sp. WMMD1127]MDG4825910.1 L,D-transpeptidase family protein [Asanoa sp. WMMD1127]
MSTLRRSTLAVLLLFALTACGAVPAERTGAEQRPGKPGGNAADAPQAARDQLARRAELLATPGATPTATPRSKPKPTSWPSGARPGGNDVHLPANDASRLRTLPADTTQVIVVKANGFDTSTGTLQAFSKRSGGWTPAFDLMPARLGGNGFTDNKTEGDVGTPTGVYSIGTTMYGIRTNPGVRYGYHKLVENDWWNENPDTAGYNTFFHGADPGGASEALWEIAPQYHYFAVINYNIPVVKDDPPRGSGIFLHVSVGRSTAGCVAISESDLVKVLRWLDPAAKPRIVMAPASELDRY